MNTDNSLSTVLYRVTWQRGTFESTPRLFTVPAEAHRYAKEMSTAPDIRVVVYKTALDWAVDRSTITGGI